MLVVANRLPVAEGQADRFEEFFEKRAALADDQPGCERVDLLRPVDADYYVIQAVWESRSAFERWRTSEAFEAAHEGIPEDLFTDSNQLEIYKTVG